MIIASGWITTCFGDQKCWQVSGLFTSMGAARIVTIIGDVYVYSPSSAYLNNIFNVNCGLSNILIIRWCENQRCIWSKEDKVITGITVFVDVDLETDVLKSVFWWSNSFSHIEVHLACDVIVSTYRNIKLLVSHIEDHATINISVTVICTYPFSIPVSICNVQRGTYGWKTCWITSPPSPLPSSPPSTHKVIILYNTYLLSYYLDLRDSTLILFQKCEQQGNSAGKKTQYTKLIMI